MGRVGWWAGKIDDERGGERIIRSVADALGVACETVSGPATQALVYTFVDLTK